jgi:hypothetical protein
MRLPLTGGLQIGSVSLHLDTPVYSQREAGRMPKLLLNITCNAKVRHIATSEVGTGWALASTLLGGSAVVPTRWPLMDGYPIAATTSSLVMGSWLICFFSLKECCGKRSCSLNKAGRRLTQKGMQFGTGRSELSEGDNFVSSELRLWHGSFHDDYAMHVRHALLRSSPPTPIS